jgi:hypothetical protein
MTRGQVVDARVEKRERRRAAKEAWQAERAREARKNQFQRIARRGASALLIAPLLGGLGWWILRPKPGPYVSSQGNAHVGSEPAVFRYASDPPTSGPHSGGTLPWGVHDRPIPKSLQVHSLRD